MLAIEAVAARHGREVRATHDIGRDRTFAGLTAPQGPELAGPDLAAVPHEALLEIAGRPETDVRLLGHDDAVVTLDGIPFDVPRDSVPAFLDAVWSGDVRVRQRTFPPSATLIVSVAGEPDYREAITMLQLTPWLAGLVR
ncbi:hypothetical protein ACWEQL_09920 [Kitasatospora sp. NPDC004240]